MIYIFGPKTISKTWELPFYLYANCISRVLNNNNIKNRIINKNNLKDVKEDDLMIVFQPYMRDELLNKIIFINSESLSIRKEILKELKNPNIKMIWDYQNKNIELLNGRSLYVPFTYHEFLEKHFIREKVEKDIDFLFYGKLNKRRSQILDRLKQKYNMVHLETTDYKTLYNHINRSKIVLYICFYENSKEFDFYRLTPLLSNKIFFLTEDIEKEDKEIKEIFENKMMFIKYENFYDECVRNINLKEEDRIKKTDELYKIFKNKLKLDKFIPIEKIKELDNSSTDI